ncbi:CCR4-NOT transcription complex subunit 1 [Phytophthora fragariae]|uniref:CCR4-NOT transcription complex subunit 1 n=1 Tax=Phytophthora fragariae TaxID=53985 RepID=A0A6G0SNQ8_9STRA|nr:CCR4-NOT transcription complex subunit 1 [Phytophthora fragariae]
MVSFASPLFWQINYLVTNLNKKNFKSNVAELNQLVELYGEDARIFLLNCLVKDIDFRDARGQKDALKIQLLTHEVSQASSRPNFTTFICEAIEGSSPDAAANGSARLITEDFLQLFCKTLKLSLPQQVTVGLAFAQGENADSSAHAIRFLRTKIPEISTCGAKLPSDVLHSLVFVLRMKKEFHADVAETDSFLASISSAHPNDMGSLEMAPLTMGDPEHVDCEPVMDADSLSKLISDVSSSCLFYELMEDVGYSCTSSPQAFRTLLAEAGLAKAPTIPPVQVAGMLAMLSRTYTGLDAENGATLMANLTIDFEATASDEAAAAPVRENWNLDVIAEVLQKDYGSIKWTKVAEKLDRADLDIQNAVQLRVLITAFQRFSQSKFRVTTLLRPWKNSRAHISILKAAVEAPPEVLSFAESPHKLAPFEGANASAVPKNGVWFSLDVVETLLQVSEQDCYGDVRKLLDGAMKTCPDVLIANLAQASPRWNALRDDMFSELFSTYIMGRPNAPLIMRHLWSVAPKLVLYASVKCFYAATAPHIVSRLFALFRNTGDSFASAIHSNYFSFALALVTMGANHDVLNLETWLVERLASQRTAFATSCLAFVHRNYARAVPKSNITPQSSHVLSIESLATILKCIMAVQGALPVTIAQELKRIITLCMETHPVISASTRPAGEVTPHVPGAATTMAAGAAAAAGVGVGGESSAGGADAPTYTAEMIEEQANAYFQQIYTSEQNINDVVAMLKRFQGSRDERERQIFYCMIHNLFDEYRFFPRYPEMELRITGVLFGKLIEHQVLPPNFLQTALRSVLESLREPVNSKFFFFGACALQQFVPRLRELPAYCTNLSQIPHLQHALPEIMRQVNQVTRSIALSGSALDASAGNGGALSSLGASLPPLSGAAEGDGISRLAVSTTTLGAGSPPRAPSGQKAQDDIALGIQIPSSILSRSAGPSLIAPSPKAPAGSPPPPIAPAPELKVDHIFHELSKVDEDEVVEQPDENVKDRIHFIVNNMSISNLEAKIPEVRKMLLPVYHAWLANYLVVKRISTQPNYHTVYLIFIEKLMRPELEREILKRTFQNARKLLTSGTITTNSQQRSLLKNLGSWLGVFTLARNKPLLQRDLDLKELLYVGYETGHLIAVTPFVAKILEGCKKSKIFKPPNPWVMGLIHAMSEIYDVPDLKLNLKFEIEVLFKSFKLNVEDQRKAQLLHTRRAPPRTANPDFNVKVPKNTMMGQRSATPPPGSGSKLGRPLTPGKPLKNVPAGSPTGREGMASFSSLGATSAAGGAAAAESTVIPNLASYVAVNPELPLRNVNLRRLVPLAVDRAIREVISPVVERSVTIACITTREVILKDFATESDDTKMRKAAHLMVASMSGSLALITAKEPLRNAIGTHLRALLPTSAGDPQQLEHVIQVCSNENTDLGCMLIEKASSEKAMRDIDEALAGAYASRRRYQQQQAQAGKAPGADGVHFFEGSASSTAVAASAGSPGAPSGHWPAALPEVFKPKPGGVPPMQLVVYEAFQRIPRPTSMPLSSRAGPSAYPGGAVDKEGDTAGVSVTAALDRFAGLLERFELFVQKVARQAAAAQRELPSLLAIPAESEVFAVLREVRALGGSVRPALRDEACLKIANRIVKFMYELGNGGRGNELFLEILVSSLEALTASCEKLRKEIVGWVLRAPVDDKLKLHCEIIVALIRYKVVEASEFDVYLARNMERNSVAIEFAVHVVRQCLIMEHVAVAAQLPNTLEALARIVERHGGATANKNVQILAALLEQARVQKLQSRPAPPAPQKSMGAIGSGASKAGGERPLIQEHAAFRHTVSNALEHWIAIYKEPTGNSKMHAQYLQMLKQYGLLADDESVSLFFKFGTELCVDACLKSSFAASDPAALKAGAKVPLNYAVLDALTHLMALLVKYLDPSPAAKLQVLNHAVGAIANVLVAAHDMSRKKKAPFDQRVFFRMFVNLMKELTAQEPALDAIHLQVLNTFASAYNTLQPLGLPGFVFAWTELISHRCFMPLLLRAKQQRGWQILHRLLMNLLVFMEPFLRHANSTVPLPDSIAALYKGVVRIILVLLHDYPDFLSDFYTSFCDVLPAACVQLRNVILSAFSRSMRLPDPLTLGLQVAQLPEVSVAPRLMPAWGAALTHNGIKEYVDEFLHASANRASMFPADLLSKLMRPAAQLERDPTSCKYALPALNALVLYLGKEGIADMANGGSSNSASAPPTPSGADGKAATGSTTSKFEQSAAMDVFRYLADELDTEGRYWYFSSLANHLRYPNSHTHYFSCVILYLFSYSNNKMVKEQITRVLIERLIANRPHPWGLLVTFIELIRNKSYKFWEQDYLECSSEIKEVFDDVARTCLGATPGASGASPLASFGGSALPSASPTASS